MDALSRAAAINVEGSQSSKKKRGGMSNAEMDKTLGVKTAMLVVALESRLRAVESVVFLGVACEHGHWVVETVREVNVMYDKTLKAAKDGPARKKIHSTPVYLWAAGEVCKRLLDKRKKWLEEKMEGDAEMSNEESEFDVWLLAMSSEPVQLKDHIKYFRRLKNKNSKACKLLACPCTKEAKKLWEILMPDMLSEDYTICQEFVGPRREFNGERVQWMRCCAMPTMAFFL